MNTEQLVTGTSAAKIKGFKNQEAFLYHIEKPDAPKPVIIDGIRFWNISEIDAWEPVRRGSKQPKET